MKKSFQIVFLSLVGLFLAALFTGCDGEAGLAGADGAAGAAGAAGMDANENCIQCHASNSVLVAKQQQWESSMHATGTSFGRGTSAGCTPCHNGAAMNVIAGGGTVATGDDVLTNNTTVGCRACHNIHTAYDTTDWALSTVAPVPLIIDPTIIADIGKGNLCINCHQPRRDPVKEDVIDSSDGKQYVNINSSHWGPHHGPQGNLLLGVGGYEVAGETVQTSPHASVVTDGCVQCHLSTEKKHQFLPQLSACNTSGCHTGLKNFDYSSVQTDVKALLEEVKDTLVSRGAMSRVMVTAVTPMVNDSGVVEYKIDTTYETHAHVGIVLKPIAGLLQNYLIVEEDGSHGVHNAKYAKFLLSKALAEVNALP